MLRSESLGATKCGKILDAIRGGGVARNSYELWSPARALLVAFVSVALLFALPAQRIRAQAKNSCLECHAMLPEPLGVNAPEFSLSVHAQKGLNCTTCHGGDASTDDLERSMSP